MLFALKKTISTLLLPFSVCLTLLAVGATLSLFRSQSSKRAPSISQLCIGSGILILLLLGTGPVSNSLLSVLENQYPPLHSMPQETIQDIVVLGGGRGGNQNYPPNTQLSSASLARLVEAVRLYRQKPNTLLVLSGGRVFGPSAEATAMNNTAMTLGVPRQHLRVEAGSQDTLEEALRLKPLLQNHPFILVTSAYHMPRAMQIFRMRGMQAIPAPTQFLSIPRSNNIGYYIPSAVSFIHSDIALHEYLGIMWFKLLTFFHKMTPTFNK